MVGSASGGLSVADQPGFIVAGDSGILFLLFRNPKGIASREKKEALIYQTQCGVYHFSVCNGILCRDFLHAGSGRKYAESHFKSGDDDRYGFCVCT